LEGRPLREIYGLLHGGEVVEVVLECFASTECGLGFQVEARIGRNLPAALTASLPKLHHWFALTHFVHGHE
jgi:hypothetical protein